MCVRHRQTGDCVLHRMGYFLHDSGVGHALMCLRQTNPLKEDVDETLACRSPKTNQETPRRPAYFLLENSRETLLDCLAFLYDVSGTFLFQAAPV